MNAEQITRKQLVGTCSAQVADLQRQGESALHIERFLSRVSRLPGNTVAEISHHWCLRQSGMRPLWSLIFWLLVGLAGWLGASLGGILVALLGASILALAGVAFQHHLWQHEGAFCRELFARAEYQTAVPGAKPWN